jgi:hypothetical protein
MSFPYTYLVCKLKILKKNHNYSFNPTPPMFEILYYNFDERMSSKKDKNKFIFFVIVYL